MIKLTKKIILLFIDNLDDVKFYADFEFNENMALISRLKKGPFFEFNLLYIEFLEIFSLCYVTIYLQIAKQRQRPE